MPAEELARLEAAITMIANKVYDDEEWSPPVKCRQQNKNEKASTTRCTMHKEMTTAMNAYARVTTTYWINRRYLLGRNIYTTTGKMKMITSRVNEVSRTSFAIDRLMNGYETHPSWKDQIHNPQGDIDT